MFSERTNWNLTTNRLSEALARYRASGRPLLDLSASNPTECGFRYDIRAIMRALCSPAALEYRPDPRGLMVARQAVADYSSGNGSRVPPVARFRTTRPRGANPLAFAWR